ncbi:cytochrome c biogenesis CcdA family protein [Brachybacterium paraconglomeratum]|uniref:cytochrome c biogenesis CcdA family protein n=1 Tax=Brachybacterium paraconglomeratum TaxID=173362 RepID=UPI00223B19A8|nr:cytochrome c biogenesis protein CcdA [Brachybacterium paraconglomeratum]MCT1438578.1 cytochrome c biogenesis protein CcdA [Brachybacterium paraconglomeratum]
MGELFATTVLSGPLAAALLLSMVAGLVAFLSPCVLPVVPGYLGYITGLTGQSVAPRRANDPEERPWRLVTGALLFVAGFTAVFLVIGGFVGALGSLVIQYTSAINRISGVLVILMGLVFVGIFPRLSGEKRIRKRPDAGLAGAPLLGITFGFSWTPCIGPTFAAVAALSLGEASASRGALLAFGYAIGLGIPFILFALVFRRALGISRVLSRHRRTLQIIGGSVLITIGLLLVTGVWEQWMDLLQVRIGNFTTIV